MTRYEYSYHNNNDLPPITEDNPWIYVFGSSTTGLLTTPDQLIAGKYYNARSGVSFGQEQTSFGIPVWDHNITILPLSTISKYTRRACEYMEHRILNAKQRYWFTSLGVSSLGHDDAEIASLFADLGKNIPMIRHHVSFPANWRPYIEPVTVYEELLFSPEPESSRT